ncbi:hypothetical protein M8J77_014603 [Diaphorina citri]|nr:hypothetical protein M8J77_014603 [Diaphorina citri]
MGDIKENPRHCVKDYTSAMISLPTRYITSIYNEKHMTSSILEYTEDGSIPEESSHSNSSHFSFLGTIIPREEKNSYYLFRHVQYDEQEEKEEEEEEKEEE